MRILIAMMLMAALAFGQADDRKSESYQADGDEHRVSVYRSLLKRKAEWVATEYHLEVIYHVATSQRREAQTEAMMLGAAPADTMRIDRETYAVKADAEGNPIAAKLRYFAGDQLIASQDVMTAELDRTRQIMARMLKLDAWARVNAAK